MKTITEQDIKIIRDKLGNKKPNYYNILKILKDIKKKQLYDHVYYIMKKYFDV